MTETPPVRLSTRAMACRFEIVLHGDNPMRLRAAGEEALHEIEQIDAKLSLYRSESEISWVNAHAANRPVKVDPKLFRLLQRCALLTEHTDGAFDVTVGPLMRVWGFVGGTGRKPDQAQLDAARAIVGMRHVKLNEDGFTVEFDQQGVGLDLGAIGKGYAIERAVSLLRENGIPQAFIHGGTSMIYAIGSPPDQEHWRVAVRHPRDDSKHLDVIDLQDSALAVSAVSGKSFMDGERELGHVIDPGTGEPSQGALTVGVTGPSPIDCDALSTALLILGESGIPTVERGFPDCSYVMATQTPDGSVKVLRG